MLAKNDKMPLSCRSTLVNILVSTAVGVVSNLKVKLQPFPSILFLPGNAEMVFPKLLCPIKKSLSQLAIQNLLFQDAPRNFPVNFCVVYHSATESPKTE